MNESTPQPKTHGENRDQLDDWDRRIADTGCAVENEKLMDCHIRTRDWRECKPEMTAFRECFAKHVSQTKKTQ